MDPTITILLLLLSECLYGSKTTFSLTQAPLVPPPSSLLSQQNFITINLVQLPSFFLLFPTFAEPSFCRSVTSSVKAIRGLLNIQRTTTGRLKGSQTLTWHFHCALPQQESAHQGLIWLSHSLSLSAAALHPPALRPGALVSVPFSF